MLNDWIDQPLSFRLDGCSWSVHPMPTISAIAPRHQLILYLCNFTQIWCDWCDSARGGRPAEEALAVRCSIFPVLLRFRSAFMIFFTSCSCLAMAVYVPGDAASSGQWQVLNSWAFPSPSLHLEFSIAMWAIPWPMQLLIHLFTGICLLDYIGFGCLDPLPNLPRLTG